MSMVINTNVLSLMTQNNLNASQSNLSTAIQRLSSACASTAPAMTPPAWPSPTA